MNNNMRTQLWRVMDQGEWVTLGYTNGNMPVAQKDNGERLVGRWFPTHLHPILASLAKLGEELAAFPDYSVSFCPIEAEAEGKEIRPMKLWRFETRVAHISEPFVDWYEGDTFAEAKAVWDEDVHRYGLPPIDQLQLTVRAATDEEQKLIGGAR